MRFCMHKFFLFGKLVKTVVSNVVLYPGKSIFARFWCLKNTE